MSKPIGFVVDVEADGPVPGEFSMVSFGIVRLDQDLETTFYGECRPISDKWIPEALAVSGHSREHTMGFSDPAETMMALVAWINEHSSGKPMFYSDNNGFDWMFMAYYLHRFTGSNPFGHNSHNIADLFKGMKRDMRANFKRLRKTKHTHHPVDDATGNAEALIAMSKMGLNINICEYSTG